MKSRRWMAFFVTVLMSLCLLLSQSVAAKENAGQVSPALSVLANQNAMAKAGLINEDIGFSATDFERALNVSSLTSLTVTELPARSDGILYLGGSEVTTGQVISRANLSFLKFVFMSEEIRSSAFCFSTNHGDYEIACMLYALPYENRTPVISSAEDAAISVGTYRDISVYGKLDAYDPDGDTLTYEIISSPRNGLLVMNDSSAGTYKYIPTEGYTGTDSFRYVVVDRYGNYSKAAEVTLTVSQPQSTLVYCDLEESAAHVAAISMTERGIMASAELDGNYYFYPTETVTRAEFLAMTMKALGIRVADSTAETVFTDDAEIPAEFRGYVNTAQKLGYICGELNGDGELTFSPNDEITRTEAAVMIYNMTELELPVILPQFGDLSAVPAWAENAVLAVTASGIMSYEGGYLSAEAPVTREDAAQMLYNLSLYEN